MYENGRLCCPPGRKELGNEESSIFICTFTFPRFSKYKMVTLIYLDIIIFIQQSCFQCGPTSLG